MASFASVAHRRSCPESGYALILALVVLAAMISIATPFLLTTRGSARISVTRAGDARARIEVDSALRGLVRRLEASDVEVDSTPGFDSRDEVHVELSLPRALYDLRNPKAAVVSARAVSEDARIDVNSASVHGLGLLFGRSFLKEEAKKDATEIGVENADAFPEKGFVWIRGELVHYEARAGGRLTGCQRGVLGSSTGPYELPADHPAGTVVLDARAHHVAKHRIRAVPGEFRPFETLGELLGVRMEPASCPPLTPDDLYRIEPHATVFGDRNGHSRFSVPFRIQSSLTADGIQRDFLTEGARYLAPGTTVKIESPRGVEYGIVVVNRGNAVTLEEPLTIAAQANEAQVSFLVPSPLFLNGLDEEFLTEVLRGLAVQRAAAIDPIPAAAAREIAKRVLDRPVKGWKDLLERVLLPLASENVINARQIEAVLRSFENPSDALLTYGTVPVRFTASSRYRVVASATVHAPSGIERGRDEVEAVVEAHPQQTARAGMGIRSVTRQTEFDELFRLSRRARGWMTYPWKSSYFDGSADPPSLTRAYLQGLTSLAEEMPIVQSEEPDSSWAQLWPSRSAHPDDSSVHFDNTLNPEGHDVSQAGPVNYDPAAAPVRWTGGQGGYLYPGSVSGWFRWNGKAVTGTLFDLGSSNSTLRERITLSIDQGDLVLRMRDAVGDDNFNVAGVLRNEIRYPAAGRLAPNLWYHFTVAFRGSGPGEYALLVDGIPRGKRSMLTHLTGDLPAISQSYVAGQIPVESTEGFPNYGVLQIGDELVEYTSKTPNAFLTQWATGQVAGSYTGGRGARHTQTTSASLHSHTAGEVVKLYGYVNQIVRDVYPGGGSLQGPLGRFSAGKARLQQNFSLVPIDAMAPGAPAPFPLGRGIQASTPLPTLRLDPLDVSDTNFIKAFSPSGGYAVMFQFQGQSTMTTAPPNASPLFGAELVYYSGVQGTDTLVGVQRGVQAGPGNTYFQARAFVIDWNNNVPANHNNNDYRFWLYVVPCSIPITGGSYYAPRSGEDGVVQLVELGAAGVGLAETTEWVHYDTLLSNHLCALAPWRWDNARRITAGPPQITPNLPGQQPPVIITFGGTIPQPTPGTVSYGPQDAIQARTIGLPMTQPVAGLVDQMQNGIPGVAQGMHFRGTDRTWSRDHLNTTAVIPAFLTKVGSIAAGRPGRLDRFRILLPGGVNGFDTRTIHWTSPHSATALWVAPSEVLPSTLIPVPPNTFDPEGSAYVTRIEDSRDWVRIAASPCGELPASATQLAVGGAYDGSGDRFLGEVDELEFRAVPAPQRTLSLGKLVLDQAVNASAQSLTFHPAVVGNPLMGQQGPILQAVAFPGATKSLGSSVMGLFPSDAGVLLLGDELIGYDSFDPGTGTVTIAPNGRGVLGTQARNHGLNETAVFLDAVVVSQLNSGMSVGAPALDVEDAGKFPPRGTLLVEDELVHFTRNTGARLEMPEFEDDPPRESETAVLTSAMRRGYGIFRGRYGTVANAHGAGELVFRFPFRYWDRWALGTDAAELHYLQCDESMASAFWGRVYWEEDCPATGASIECLARLDERTPWRSYSSKADGLWLFRSGSGGAAGGGTASENRIKRLGERLELRFGVRYANGAFDPLTSPITNDSVRSDAWKSTPRLRSIAVERFGENRVLWKEERP